MDKTPKVLGIVSLVLGSLMAVGSIVGLLGLSLAKAGLGYLSAFLRNLPQPRGGQGPDFDQFAERYSEMLDAVRPYQLAQSTGMLVLSVAIALIGIAMLKRQPWSRKAAMGWAVAALAFIPVVIWVQAFVVQPMAQDQVSSFMQVPAQANQNVIAEQRRMMGMLRPVQTAMTVATSVGLYAPFPVALFLLLKRRRSDAWFSPAPSGPGPAAP